MREQLSDGGEKTYAPPERWYLFSAIGLSQVSDTMQNPINTWGNQNPEGVFDKTILQGRPVIRQQEVLENDQNIGDVKHLQDTLFHKGEAVFNVDDFEAEKNKRGSSYTIQDYAKEWLARKTPNVKRDTAAYQALEKEIVQQMGNAYALTQKETKKAAPKDDAVQENILNGQKAVEQVIKSHSDVKGAMYRDGIGSIDFIWGKEGDASKEYRGGYGISHIIAHRNAQGFDGVAIAKKMPEVIMTGKITLDSPYKVSIETDGYKAVLAKNKNGTPSDPWLLTGFNKIDKTKEVSSERREGFDSSTPTADTPTQTRRTGADTSSISIITQKAEKGNKPDELDGVNILWNFFE